MKKQAVLLAVLLGSSLLAAAQDTNVASQCLVGSVKLTWKPVARCIVIDNEAKFKATLSAWGWDAKNLPKVNFAKEMAVLDSANNPYGNAEAKCNGLSAGAEKKNAKLNWAWVQNVEPSVAVAREKAKAEGAHTSSVTKDMKVKDKAVGAAMDVKDEAVQGLSDVAHDMKKFPNPSPKRAAVIAVFPKDALGATPKIDCVMEK